MYILNMIRENVATQTILEELHLRDFEELPPHYIEAIKHHISPADADIYAKTDEKFVIDLIQQFLEEQTLKEAYSRKRASNFRYEWIQMDAQKMEITKKLQDLAMRDFSQYCRLYYNYSNEFIKALKQKRDEFGHAVIYLNGIRGSGKSISAQSIAEIIGKIFKKEYTAEHTYTSRAELTTNVKNMQKGDVMIEDEIAVKELGIGTGLEDANFGNVVETLRAEQINFLFCSATKKDNIAQTVDYTLETYAMTPGLENKKFKLLVWSRNILLGYIIVDLPSKRNLAIYTDIKKRFSEAQKKLEGTDRMKYIDELSDKLMKHPEWKFAKNSIQRSLVFQKAIKERITHEMKNLIIENATLKEKSQND